ncbi:MAG: sulfatase, partial [Bacteroidota bacterium]
IGCKEEQKAEVSEVQDKSPNVLIIYPDQLRRYSAGFWSEAKYREYTIGKPDPVETPNMDRLAKNGVVFSNAISNFPLCSPARGMFLTGRFPEQNGIWNNCRVGREESLHDDLPAITDIFYEAGYNTAYFGKCHWLKNDPLFDKDGNYVGSNQHPGGHHTHRFDTYIPPGKSRHSIEYFYQSLTKNTHYDPVVFSSDPHAIMGKKDGEIHQVKAFSAKDESEKIISYLNNHNKVRDPNKPFFIMWATYPPHNPWDDENTDMGILEKYYGLDRFPELDSLVVRDNADLEVAKYARHYFAIVTSVDFYIGSVIRELEKMGELDNTIVILSSDHGEMLGSHGRKGKNTLKTEALGIPFIIHWPNGLKGGEINDMLFGVPDVLPTTLSLAGLKKSIPDNLEGMDFSSSLLTTQNMDFQEPQGILIILRNAKGIHTKRYTLCIEENKELWETKQVAELNGAYLYDNQSDPYQQEKIPLDQKPEIARSLLGLLGQELKRSNDPWYQERKYSGVIIYD